MILTNNLEELQKIALDIAEPDWEIVHALHAIAERYTKGGYPTTVCDPYADTESYTDSDLSFF